MEIIVSEEPPEDTPPGQLPRWVLVDGDDDCRQVSPRVYDYQPTAERDATIANRILEKRPDLTPRELDRAIGDEW